MRLTPTVRYGRCGHPIASYKPDDALCFACEEHESWGPSWHLPIELLLVEMSCEEIAGLGVFGKDTAHRIKRRERRLTTAEERALRAALKAREATERNKKPKPREGEPVGDTVKLVPAERPERIGATNWRAVVDEFLASGMEAARVDSNRTAKAVYHGLRPASKGKPCYPSVRRGACYLVRSENNSTEEGR